MCAQIARAGGACRAHARLGTLADFPAKIAANKRGMREEDVIATIAKHAGLALVLSGLLASTASAQTKITMMYSAVTGFASAFVAAEQGYFKKRGLDVELQLTNNTANVPAALVSNSVQVGGTTIPTVIQAIDAGLDLVLFAAGGVFPLEGDALVARQGSNIQKPADLKGKTIGVPGIGALLHFMLVRYLKQNGIDPNEVKFVEVGFVQSGDALKSGSIDVFPAVAPFSSRIIQSGAGYAFAEWLKDTPDGTLTVVHAATRKWATENKDTVAKFREAMGEANAFIKEAANREQYNVATAKYTRLPPPVVAALKPPNLVVDMTPTQVKWWIDLAKDQKLIKTDIDAAKLIVQP
jgi:NitT/TauT family transport system substrate-binding protein